jgi:hypothetical protein
MADHAQCTARRPLIQRSCERRDDPLACERRRHPQHHNGWPQRGVVRRKQIEELFSRKGQSRTAHAGRGVQQQFGCHYRPAMPGRLPGVKVRLPLREVLAVLVLRRVEQRNSATCVAYSPRFRILGSGLLHVPRDLTLVGIGKVPASRTPSDLRCRCHVGCRFPLLLHSMRSLTGLNSET